MMNLALKKKGKLDDSGIQVTSGRNPFDEAA